MTFSESVSTCFRKYVDFSGRARRSEYWWFFLFSAVVSQLSEGVDHIIGSILPSVIVTLALTLPGFSAGSRRLHDLGHSGWWQAIPWGLILGGLAIFFAVGPENMPGIVMIIVGAVISVGMLIYSAFPGTAGPNIYGPVPED